MAVYKVIERCPWRKTQILKKIYESDAKFEKWGRKYAKGCQFRSNVEVYKMVDEKYELIYTLEMPVSDEDITNYVIENKMYFEEANWRIKDLKKEIEHFKNVHNKELCQTQ